ncbi:hypothetical protein FNF27_07735 [Cafeteria roenbergensis]|uniref:Cytochrome b561 domain-containing protein n=2 Tax=Cafeteria roenbergensis TaxID=33653 RepID=A0A5A8DHG7_CAFRO|nr:hypothetical protein FNF27_07735 [Cafeteria roenbergensis]
MAAAAAWESEYGRRAAILSVVLGTMAAILCVATAIQKSSFIVFLLHPIAASAAFGGCMMWGVGAYYGSAASVPRVDRRSVHRRLNVAAAALLLVSAAAIVSNKVVQGKSLVPRSFHGWAGLAVLAAVGVQVWSGLNKARALAAGAGRRHPWHGNLGVAVLVGGMTVMVLGAVLMRGALDLVSGAAAALAAGAVAAAVLSLWWGRQAGAAKAKAPESAARDDDTAGLVAGEDADAAV